MQIGKAGTVIFRYLQKSISPGLRFMSRDISALLKYKEYGEPVDVLQLCKEPLETNKLKENEVFYIIFQLCIIHLIYM